MMKNVFNRVRVSLHVLIIAASTAGVFSRVVADDFAFYRAKLPKQSEVSFLVAEPNALRPLMSHDVDSLKPPASTLKMVTALAIRLTFSETYTFVTKLEALGDSIVIRFGGDPYLKENDLLAMLLSYKNRFGGKIRGDIYLDASIMDGHHYAEGTAWENLSACYSAPASGLTLNENCVRGQLNSHFSEGKVAKVQLPADQSLKVDSTVQIVTKALRDKTDCSLDASLASDNRYLVSGCTLKTERPLPLNFAVQNPEQYVKARLKKLLKQADIQLSGQLKVKKMKAGKLIAQHDSPPVREILSDIILHSNNLASDMMLKMLGHHYFQASGNFVNGAKAVKAILKERANIDLSESYIVDGAGLSRSNRLSPRQLYHVMAYIHAHNDQLNLLEMLPVSGVSGTLQYRKGTRQDELVGKIRAKTGHIFSTYNLVGLLETQSGKPLLFVQMVTDYLPADERNVRKDGRETRISGFEKAIYTDLYREKPSLTKYMKSQTRG
ncbi:MAG: D-alanyl-D-alanine carboxypeptidase/D-alanyl-D-alanine-endopeptidase [Cellvibrionales bacterium]|nr:D-alanyl-D-alanine carboxypeptidase/D-alanyl-D-alanine-endopeptidase [Cellvibrionales bacterium]